MGVDCKITLPAAARVRDVADVMGALVGHTLSKQYFKGDDGGWSAGRKFGSKGVEIKQCEGMPECVRIHLNNTADVSLPDGEPGHYAMYHFEWGKDGTRGLMPPSSAFWIAVGRGLVDFFGGSLDYNDCDDSKADYEQPERSDIHAEDDDGWFALQNRKLAVKPLTKDDLKALRGVAAY